MGPDVEDVVGFPKLDGAASGLSDVLGPWVPERDTGYNALRRPWVLRRANTKWSGGVQTMQTANFMERRFASESAAKKAADTENGHNAELRTQAGQFPPVAP